MDQKEEINSQPEENEARIPKKMRRSLGISGTTLNIPTSESYGCQKEKRRKKIENLFEKIMKENFPNLAKEIDFQEVQKAQRVPKRLDQGGIHQGTS